MGRACKGHEIRTDSRDGDVMKRMDLRSLGCRNIQVEMTVVFLCK